ncbi:MAG: alpha/beta hydrolase [Gammaproteobacteria bacterium]|nr:alpha/beta hydrolase [Gammaproteobacteria bacterium]
MLTETPSSHIYFSQRLRLHYVDWGNEDAPPLLLIHGGRDHCRNWDWVASELRNDYHVIAPDLRGHGDSQWMVGGGYLHIDYVYDIAQLVQQKHMSPVTVMGHSLGGSISLIYAGLYPETITKLISIEGMGTPPRWSHAGNQPKVESRLQNWINSLRHLSSRSPRKYATLEDAFHRMQTENPHLTEEQARHLTIHGSNQNEDGTFSWKFDNYVRTFAPIGLSDEEIQSLYARINAPTLLIYGKESWASDPGRDGRARAFKHVEVAGIDDAGHWSHHDQFNDFISIVKNFLASD